jgi:hypothetical protein
VSSPRPCLSLDHHTPSPASNLPSSGFLSQIPRAREKPRRSASRPVLLEHDLSAPTDNLVAIQFLVPLSSPRPPLSVAHLFLVRALIGGVLTCWFSLRSAVGSAAPTWPAPFRASSSLPTRRLHLWYDTDAHARPHVPTRL